jgi:hypothetical protein
MRPQMANQAIKKWLKPNTEEKKSQHPNTRDSG